MTSLTTAWSPSSYQLRAAFQCRRSPAILARTRLKKLDRALRVVSAARDGAPNDSGVERRRSGDTWTSSASSVDAYAGWSGSNGAGPSSEYQRKKWLTGIVGAGVAGVVLFAGLIFTSLSLSKRSIFRSKQQMEPLTAQQEVSFAPEDENDGVLDSGNERSSQGITTGIDEDSPLSPQLNGSSIQNRFDDGTVLGLSSTPTVKNTPNLVEAINNSTIQEDLQHESAFDDMSVAPDTTPSSPRLPESDIDTGSSSFRESGGNLSAGTMESSTDLKVNRVDVRFSDSLVSDVTEPLGVGSGFMGTESSEFSLDSSSRPVAYIPGEPLPVNISVSPEVDAVLEPLNVSMDDIESVTLLSTKEDIDLHKALEVSAESYNMPLEVHNLSDCRSSNGENEVNRSRKLDELPTTQNSFSSAGIPAPSVVSAALQVRPGKVLFAAAVDQVQGQALAALQVLKVIEDDAQPSDLCTRREYARWLLSASSALSSNTVSKVYPAMYIENITELAFDDIMPEDPDFPSIQGLAEAGLISSKLSRHDMLSSIIEDQGPLYFSPESPLSRQDLVSWKMALEKRQLPEADRKILHQLSGFIDIDKINPDAWPALMADLSVGDQGIIALAFGYTKLFQPDKPVTKAQAAIAVATGEAFDMVNEELARIEAETMAENAVAAHSALVAQVEKDLNASFEKELSMEREKINTVEKLAEEARQELERLRAEREEENVALLKEHAAVESEMEVLSRLRYQVEEQLQSLMSNKVEMSYEKEKISQLRKDAENENQEIARLQHELEVERKALSMARRAQVNLNSDKIQEHMRSWAEMEAQEKEAQEDTREETTRNEGHLAAKNNSETKRSKESDEGKTDKPRVFGKRVRSHWL